MPLHIGKSFLLVSGHRGILDKVLPGPKEAQRATEHPASLPTKRSGLLAAIPWQREGCRAPRGEDAVPHQWRAQGQGGR